MAYLILPKKQLEEWKVVQATANGKDYLFAQKTPILHAQILERIITKERIVPSMVPNPDYPDEKIPAPFGEEYQVHGMGYCEKKEGFIEFWGRSHHYQVGINKIELERVASEHGRDLRMRPE